MLGLHKRGKSHVTQPKLFDTGNRDDLRPVWCQLGRPVMREFCDGSNSDISFQSHHDSGIDDPASQPK
jgi:CDGSH-type Zn-finger protein